MSKQKSCKPVNVPHRKNSSSLMISDDEEVIKVE